MKKNISKFVYWTPRIFSIIFILFLMLFSLDVFAENLSFWETALGLFIHNIPALTILIVLLISWKHEIVGGIAFILAGILYIVGLLIKPKLEWYMISWVLMIAGPAFFIGILFLMNWFRKKRKK